MMMPTRMDVTVLQFLVGRLLRQLDVGPEPLERPETGHLVVGRTRAPVLRGRCRLVHGCACGGAGGFARAAVTALVRQGYEVSVAMDGLAALETARRSQPDLITMAVAAAALLSQALAARIRWIKTMILSIFFLLMSLGIFNNFQYYHGAIHWDSMTKEAYLDSFGRVRPSAGFYELLEAPDYDKAKEGADR